MRTFLSVTIALGILAIAVPASAEEPQKHTILESQTDLGGVIGLTPKFGVRLLSRTVLNKDDGGSVYEFHSGLAWQIAERLSFDLTIGYAVTATRTEASHELMIGTWKDMVFLGDKLAVHLEGLHRYDGDYIYEGYYSLDYAVVGIHLSNRSKDASAGLHLGSGRALLPFRFELRPSYGLTDGAPNLSASFFMSIDIRH